LFEKFCRIIVIDAHLPFATVTKKLLPRALWSAKFKWICARDYFEIGASLPVQPARLYMGVAKFALFLTECANAEFFLFCHKADPSLFAPLPRLTSQLLATQQ
jgi:hypothetical protein